MYDYDHESLVLYYSMYPSLPQNNNYCIMHALVLSIQVMNFIITIDSFVLGFLDMHKNYHQILEHA